MELKPGDFVLYATKIADRNPLPGTVSSPKGEVGEINAEDKLIPEILFKVGKIKEVKENVVIIEYGKETEETDFRAIRFKFEEGKRFECPDFDMEFVATGKPMPEETKEFLRKCRERERVLDEQDPSSG